MKKGFRVWNKKLCKYESNLDEFFIDGEGGLFQRIWDDSITGDRLRPLSVEECVVELAVGLLDMYDETLYDGDIILARVYPFVSDGLVNYHAKICYSEREFAWYYDIFPVSDRVRGCACGGTLEGFVESGCKIEKVGNIHDEDVSP